jgi:Rieske Fe-S protein
MGDFESELQHREIPSRFLRRQVKSSARAGKRTMENHMNERRRFLLVLGSGAMAMGTGCSAVGSNNVVAGSGAGGSGAGGSGAGGGGAGGSGGTTTTTTTTGPTCTMSPTGTKLGKPTDYASNGLHIVTNTGILIGRDAAGLYALTAICTHQLCDMSVAGCPGPCGQISGKNITCLCHGSEFGPTGSVVAGPALTPLRAYALALGCDGFLYANKTHTVANTVRLMV